MYAQIREFGIFSLREDSIFILIVFSFFDYDRDQRVVEKREAEGGKRNLQAPSGVPSQAHTDAPNGVRTGLVRLAFP